MEYVISHDDADGNSVDESHILELKETYFQSFYVPDGHTLTNVYFLTGNNQEGDVKLQISLDDLHPGIDTDYNMDIPTLTPKFKLDKHENREFVNFNWLGTGLFEKYDTLFIDLRDNLGKKITKAQMNVHRVDDDGTLVVDNDVRYLGYDKNSDRHKVLTHGHPAYIEIIANGCLPTLYRYKGAADKDNKIVRYDLCSAKITMKKGKVGTNGFAVCDQNLLSLKDDLIPITRNNTEYAVVSVLEASLTGRPKSEVFCYLEDGGIKFPKLLNNSPVQKLAQLELVFSTNKGSSNPSCHLTCKERETGTTREAGVMETVTVSSREFTNFTRDYYFTRFNLLGVVGDNKQFQMTLSTPDASYDDFPILKNLVVDPEQIAQDGEKQSTQDTDLDKDKSNKENVYDSDTFVITGENSSVTIDSQGHTFYTKLLGNNNHGGILVTASAYIPTESPSIQYGMIDKYTLGLRYNGVYFSIDHEGFYDDLDNMPLIGYYLNRGTVNAKFNGRKLYKDGAWNTLCLPFNMTGEQLSAAKENKDHPLYGATVWEMDVDGWYNSSNERSETRSDEFCYQTSLVKGPANSDKYLLYLYFKDATTIEAGKPYLVKWDKPNGYDANPDDYDITDPVFNEVEIKASLSAIESDDGSVLFVPIFSPVILEKGNWHNLYVGANNMLKYPSSANDFTLKSFRGYFQLMAGDEPATDPLARSVDIISNIDDDDTSGIKDVTTPLDHWRETSGDAWYTLDGRKLDGKPVKKGIYIHHGNMFVIK